jgi:hypothetical protein
VFEGREDDPRRRLSRQLPMWPMDGRIGCERPIVRSCGLAGLNRPSGRTLELSCREESVGPSLAVMAAVWKPAPLRRRPRGGLRGRDVLCGDVGRQSVDVVYLDQRLKSTHSCNPLFNEKNVTGDAGGNLSTMRRWLEGHVVRGKRSPSVTGEHPSRSGRSGWENRVGQLRLATLPGWVLARGDETGPAGSCGGTPREPQAAASIR